MTVWTLVKSGGWIMLPLLLCSLAVWGIFLERFLAYRGWQMRNRQFLLTFSNLWLKEDWDAAKKLSEKSSAELASLAAEILEKRQLPKSPNNTAVISNRLDRIRINQSQDLKKNLWLLGTIGSSSPFIGLFGTVVGIIESFHNMSVAGAGGFTVVASGISQALVATAGGIIVAVFSVFLYNYFQMKVSRLQFSLKQFCEDIRDLWEQSPRAE